MANALHMTLNVCILLLVASVLSAQSFRGSIRGKVRDAHGALIAGAKVSAKSLATELLRDAQTGPDGAYVLAELPVGEYSVTAEFSGLSPVGQNAVVSVGLDTTADFDLTKVDSYYANN